MQVPAGSRRRGVPSASVLRGLAVVAPLVVLAGCGPKPLDGPEEQYRNVLEQLGSGSAHGAYRELMPPEYDRDLNELWAMARNLISREEYALLREFADEAGRRLADSLERRSADAPLFATLADGVRDLPALLGLPDYATFRASDVSTILAALDAGLYRSLALQPVVAARLSTSKVQLLEVKGSWAKLRFLGKDGEGRETREDQELVRVDGKWVPSRWAIDWPKLHEEWRSALESLAERKKDEPDWVARNLEGLRPLLERSDSIVLDLLGAAGLAD